MKNNSSYCLFNVISLPDRMEKKKRFMTIFNTTPTYGITLHLHRYIYIFTTLYLFLRCSLNSVNVFLVRIDSVSPSTLLCCGTIKQSSFQHSNMNQAVWLRLPKELPQNVHLEAQSPCLSG